MEIKIGHLSQSSKEVLPLDFHVREPFPQSFLQLGYRVKAQILCSCALEYLKQGVGILACLGVFVDYRHYRM